MTNELLNFFKYVSNQQLSSIPTLFPPDLDDSFLALAISNVINVLTFISRVVGETTPLLHILFSTLV